MRWTRLLCTLALAVAGWSVPAAEPSGTPVEGRIEVDGGRVDILSTPIPVGRRIDLPEGWYRVEEGGSEDGAVGSFTVVGSSRGGTVGREAALPSDGSPVRGLALEGERPPPGDPAQRSPCRTQRSAFYRELWRQSGVDVDDPEALLEGLDAGTSGPAAGYYWFALQADPFRNLAWSSELRGRAAELVRCVREAGATPRR